MARLDVGRVGGVALGAPPAEVVHVGVPREEADVDGLGQPDVSYADADAGADGGQQLGEPGVHPTSEEARTTGPGRPLDGGEVHRVQAGPGEELRTGDHVDATAEDRRQLVDIGVQRRVDDAVGLQREERLRVTRGEDAGGLGQSAEFGDVPAVLGVRVGEGADEPEVGTREYGPDGLAGHVAGRPLDHAERPRDRRRAAQRRLRRPWPATDVTP